MGTSTLRRNDWQRVDNSGLTSWQLSELHFRNQLVCEGITMHRSLMIVCIGMCILGRISAAPYWKCPLLQCSLICDYGYEWDENGFCEICQCYTGPIIMPDFGATDNWGDGWISDGWMDELMDGWWWPADAHKRRMNGGQDRWSR